MKILKATELEKILRLHKLWLENKPKGAKADLSNCYLKYANLKYANLQDVDLRNAFDKFSDKTSGMKSNKDPLILAIELKQKALKTKAHPKVILQIEKQISNEARKALAQFMRSDKQFPVISKVLDNSKF